MLCGCGEDVPTAEAPAAPQPPPVVADEAPAPAPPPPEPRFADVVWLDGVPSGVIPLSEERLVHQRHLRLTDADGKVTVAEHLSGDRVGRRWVSEAVAEGSRRVTHHDDEGAVVMVVQVIEGGAKLVREDKDGRPIDPACVYYAVERDDGGRAVSETCMGVAGAAIADRHGVAKWTFELDELGRRVEARSWLNGGRPIAPLGQTYEGVKRVWDAHGVLIQRLRLGPSGRPVSVKVAGFTSEEWDHDASGRLIEHRYEDGAGKKVPGPAGWSVQARRYEPQGEGARVVIRHEDPSGALTRRAGDGVARVDEDRDAVNRLLSRSVFDVDGSPTVEGDVRAHRVVHTYDDAGRLASSAWFGVGGRPSTHPALGVHRREHSYDEAGHETALAYRDGLGALVAGSEGWARRVTRYNGDGKVEVIAYEGPDGQPVGRAEDGVARLFHFYGFEGRLMQIASSGTSGRPIARAGGYGREVWEYDDQGRVSAEAWFDLLEAPMTHQGRDCARETLVYDAQGDVAERRCVDADGAPTISSVWDAAGVREERDGRGLVVRETWLDPQGAPMMTRRGYATKVTRYDARGAVFTVSLLDAQGRPTFGTEGWSEQRYTRDPQGREVSVRAVDTLGNLVADAYGVAQRQTTRAGAWTKTRMLGVDGQPIGVAGGLSGRDVKRDAWGRVVAETALDVTGLPLRDPETGCATLETDYDAWGAPVLKRCKDPQGLLSLGRGGWASLVHGYDARGRGVSIERFDTAKQPVLGDGGWFKELRSYSDRGWLSRRVTLDLEEGQVGSATVLSRDLQGRVVREQALGPADEPVMNAEGWSAKRLDYDALGRLISEGYTGTDDISTTRQILRTRYGLGGRVVARRWLDANGAVALGPEGWAIERLTYDARGRLVARVFFDTQDEPGIAGHPRTAERHVRDRMGRLLERRAMASSDTLIDGFGVGKRRWAIERQRYDARGRRTSLSIFDVEDRPTVGADGLHRVRWSWDDRGQLLVQERFVAPGQGALGGWARQEHRYDRFGRLIAINYQDTMGQAATVWNGVAQVRLSYGRDGRLATMRWQNAKGEAMDAKVCFPGAFCARRAVHEARYRYDGSDEPVEMTLHDRRGAVRKTLDCAKGQCF